MTAVEKIRLLPPPRPGGRWRLAWILPDEGPGPFDRRAYEAAMAVLGKTEGARLERDGSYTWAHEAHATAAMWAAHQAVRPVLETVS
jgi:hypothetical protein